MLDARDKLYRLVNAKSTDIKQVTSFKGTCKDMCPEKERLMREARLQVASFEAGDTHQSMDPRKAIKQYSRSAADAETPLPHELRPESSLKTTMTYLLHNIMNLCDDEDTSIGDWFHFVWDRTRGIRKDITQQELCSPITVELVEQCVRFHIHCGARLVAEDPSIFDQKINTENLTKCLQTLKYVYNDLKLKGVSCPNEAEFRAYVVLLNLNESGNFLWEIKQLEKSILNSKDVRFALDVYFAIANNNYVKFFNLVREASYMGACLLMRYFQQVRMKAISIIMKSYTPRKGGFNFSISYLVDNLGFEDYETTVNFLQHHGLMCDPDGDIVFLDRSTFGSGDNPYQMDRAFTMIESKMESSVAEAVCGGPLPSPESFKKLVPHSSFDNDGFLKRESFYAEDQNGPCQAASRDNVFKVPKGSPPVSPGRSMFQRVQKNDQPDVGENPFMKSATSAFAAPKKTIFGSSQPETKQANPFASKIAFASPQNQSAESIFGNSAPPVFGQKPVASSPFAKAPQVQSVFGKLVEAPSPFSSSKETPSFGKSTSAQAKSIFGVSMNFGATAKPPSLAFTEQVKPAFGTFIRNEELERMEKEEAATVEKLRIEEKQKTKAKQECLRVQQELEMKQLEDERARLEAELLLEVELERAINETCVTFVDTLIDDVVAEKVREEASQSVAVFVTLSEQFYEVLEFDAVVEEIAKIHSQEFLAYVNQTKMKYEAMYNSFNQWRQTTKEEIRRREKLSNIGCSILNSSLEQQAGNMFHPEQSVALSNMKQYLTGSPQSIVLPDMDRFQKINLFDELKVKAAGNVYWKILLSIPHKNEEKSLGFASFIKHFLSKTFDSSDDEIFYMQQHQLKNSRSKLSICMRKVQGAGLINEKGEKSPEIVAHSNGIVFFTTSTNLQSSRRRLQNILDLLELPVPVSIIVYKNQVQPSDEDELRQFMDLSVEVNVSTFEINIYYECHEKDKDLPQVTLEAIQFLSDCHSCRDKLLDLEQQHVLDFFQLTIGDEMWRRVELSFRQSDQFRNFNNVVHLYNASIDKLMVMVVNDFRKLPSFPAEFRKTLAPANARLPQTYEHFAEDWRSGRNQKVQLEFLHDLKLVKMQNDAFESFDDFKTKLMKFLGYNISEHKDKVFQAIVAKVIDFLYRQNLVSDEDVLEAINSFCWLKVLAEIVIGKFNEIYQQRQIPSTITYNKKDLQRYKDVPWWLKVHFPSTERQDEEPQAKKQKLTPPTSKDIEAMLQETENSLNKLNSKIESFKKVSTKTREVSKDFDRFLLKFEESFQGKITTLQEKFND